MNDLAEEKPVKYVWLLKDGGYICSRRKWRQYYGALGHVPLGHVPFKFPRVIYPDFHTSLELRINITKIIGNLELRQTPLTKFVGHLGEVTKTLKVTGTRDITYRQ